MNSTHHKRGRKPKPYVCPWNNETVDGLYRCPDGRWRINATGEKFTERDPILAVGEFRRRESRRLGIDALVPIALGPVNQDPDLNGAMEFLLRTELGAGEHRGPVDDSLVLKIPADAADPVSLARSIPTASLWGHF